MKYSLVYTRTAFDDIKKLDPVAKKRIKEKLEQFSFSPFKYAKKLINPTIGSYRFRVGNYRIIFDIDKNNIVILRVGHRREIYK
jgi:mRNA interferase RelE/StbE